MAETNIQVVDPSNINLSETSVPSLQERRGLPENTVHWDAWRQLVAAGIAAATLSACALGEHTNADNEATATSVEAPAQPEAATTTTLFAPEAKEKPKEVPPVTSATSTSTQPERKTPQVEKLAAEEVETIIDASGFEGLSSHNLNALHRFTTPGGRKVVLVGVEQAKSTASFEEIERDFEIAENAAALRRPVTAPDVWLGPGAHMPVEIIPRPADLTSSTPDTSFVLFTNIKLETLADPIDISSLNSSQYDLPRTGVTVRKPYFHKDEKTNVSGVTVTLLSTHTTEGQVAGYRASDLARLAEIIHATHTYDLSANTESQIDKQRPNMSYILEPSSSHLDKKLKLAELVGDTHANSLSFLLATLRSGNSYDVGLAQSIPMTADIYQHLGMMYIGYDPAYVERVAALLN